MARYFLDSSALVKRYHDEKGTNAVEALLGQRNDRFFVSRLALVEVNSAFARLVRERVIGPDDFGRLVARLEADVAAGLLTVAAVSSPRLAAASTILRVHGMSFPIRTLDAIHLANAQALHERATIAAFVAADGRLLAAARDACGLSVLDVSG